MYNTDGRGGGGRRITVSSGLFYPSPHPPRDLDIFTFSLESCKLISLLEECKGPSKRLQHPFDFIERWGWQTV